MAAGIFVREGNSEVKEQKPKMGVGSDDRSPRPFLFVTGSELPV
jgi:hypothetical protein